MNRLIAAVVLMFAVAGPVRAGSFVNGNELLGRCTSESGFDSGLCRGYLQGIVDASVALATWEFKQDDGGRRPGTCLPNDVTVGQVVDVWLKYAKEHPEKRHLAAASLTLNAFEDAWPCPRK
jgi:hypothetical protein